MRPLSWLPGTLRLVLDTRGTQGWHDQNLNASTPKSLNHPTARRVSVVRVPSVPVRGEIEEPRPSLISSHEQRKIRSRGILVIHPLGLGRSSALSP
jgi:hypothetical protein